MRLCNSLPFFKPLFRKLTLNCFCFFTPYHVKWNTIEIKHRKHKVIFSIKPEYKTKNSKHALNTIVEIKYQNLIHIHSYIYTYICICPIHVYIHTYTYISIFTIVEVLFINLNRSQGLCLFIHSYMYSFNSVDCLLHVKPCARCWRYHDEQYRLWPHSPRS